MMKHMKLLGFTAILLSAATANAAVSFSIAGLAGTGVTADVSFGYAAIDANNGTITISITNTTLDSGDTAGSFITAFAFNTPSIDGVTISSIGGDMDDLISQAVTELGSPNEAGWYARLDGNTIKTPNAAGDFDFGVMNNDTVNAFITDGTGGPSSPKIFYGETTTFTLDVTGSGLAGLSDASFMNELSVDGTAGAFNFGVRFQGIGPNDDSDFAVVPVPAAVLLCVVGLFSMGVTHCKRRR